MNYEGLITATGLTMAEDNFTTFRRPYFIEFTMKCR